MKTTSRRQISISLTCAVLMVIMFTCFGAAGRADAAAAGDAVEIAAGAAAQGVTLSGTVYTDLNRDGARGLGEPAVAGASVQVYNTTPAGRRLAAAATSDARGRYSLVGLPVGDYAVAVQLPAAASLNSAARTEETSLQLTADAAGSGTLVDLGLWAGEGMAGLPGPDAQTRFSDNRVVVAFKPGTSRSQAEAIAAGQGMQVENYIGSLDIYVLSGARGQAPARMAQLSTLAGVLYAELDTLAYSQLAPTDPDYNNVWRVYAPQRINAPAAWDVTTGSASVVVAIVDSGLSLTHPEFTGRLVAGYDFVNKDADPSDDNGHGTHVAGIVAAGVNNGIGMVGMAPNVKIMPVKVLNASGSGYWSDIAAGITYAVDNGARVINLSLGGITTSQPLCDAIQYAAAHNVVVVAAAGNNGNNKTIYPASYETVIAVSATDEYDRWWTLSSYGTWVDVSAPGSTVWSTYWTAANPDGYQFMSGTSMAAPHVSGIAALLVSQQPALSAAAVRAEIESSAADLGEPGYDQYYGFGRADAAAALGVAPTATATPAPTATSAPTATATPAPTATSAPTATATPAPTATPVQLPVGGLAFVDMDTDGVFDAQRDTPLSNVPITVERMGDPLTTILTDEDGRWAAALNCGVYTITAPLQANAYVLYTDRMQLVTLEEAPAAVDFAYIAPTSVVVENAQAAWVAEGVRVAWAMSAWMDTEVVGFQIYRSYDAQSIGPRVNTEIITPMAPGGTYAYVDTGVTKAGGAPYYWIEAITVSGNHWAGPFAPRGGAAVFIPLISGGH